MVSLPVLRCKKSTAATATILLSCLVVSSFTVLSAESIRARPLAATTKDPGVVLSTREDNESVVVQHRTPITPLTRPARIPNPQDEEYEGEEEGLLLQLQRQWNQKQNQLYDIQPVFIVDQTEYDVYLGLYPDKRPRPLNASAKRRKKKKKKKKKVVIEGQDVTPTPEEIPPPAPPVPGKQYQGPMYEQRSVPGFHMATIEAPWRHRMSYTLDWTLDSDLGGQIEEGLTRAEAMRQAQARQYEDTHHGVNGDKETPTTPAVVEKQKLRTGSELVMDFQLIPLDHVKTNELLLTRVSVSSLQAHIQLRSEVLEGWYRLQIQFWEEPDPTSLDCDLFSSSATDRNNRSDKDGKDNKDMDWNSTDSILLDSPGRLKLDTWTNKCFPRQVGIWRSAEAIEVTGLGPKDLEWNEFIETLSRETRQERWSLAEFSSQSSSPTGRTSRELQKAILREEHLAMEEFREPRPVVVAETKGGRWGWGIGQLSGIHHRIKGFLANHPPWGTNSNKEMANTATEPATSSSTADGDGSSSTSTPELSLRRRQRQEKRPYERTIFAQDSFRYQEFVGPNIKDVVPDFLVQELEEFEDAEMDALEARQERILQQKKQQQQDGQKVEGVVVEEEGEDVLIYPMSEWNPEIARLQELIDIWNAGTLLKKRDSDGDSGDSMEERSSEEVVVDRIDQEEEEEELILEVEGGEKRLRGQRLNPRIWQGAIETDSYAAATWRSNRDRIITWQISPTLNLQDTLLLDIELVATPTFSQQNQQTTRTRETIVQAVLEKPSVALLTDRVPVSWKAVQVTLPAWVPTGTYHIRIRGVSEVVGSGGIAVEDVSQPFVVLSDPYL
ncbi:hypothetical protein BGZ97_009925, partial [Linnemannia gamsii]